MTLRIRSGGSWVDAQLRIRSGSSWVTPTSGRIRSGGSWVDFLSVDTEIVTVGTVTNKAGTWTGYYQQLGVGSISNGLFAPKGNAAIQGLYHYTGSGAVIFTIAGTHTNAGWSTMTVGSTNFNRSSATFSNTNPTSWSWTASNPFSAVGSNTTVVFT